MTLKNTPAALLIIATFTTTAWAQQATQRVTVETTPTGAKVFVDGKDNGIACQSGPNCKPRMTRGAHRLIIELDGFQTLEETISVTGAQRFAFTLHPVPGRLDIKTLATNTSARGAELYVDGTLSGSVPSTVEVPAGKHVIEVRRPGYQNYTESVEVKGAETRAVFVSLASESKQSPTAGAVRVTSDPPGAEVTVDDQPRGPAPVLVDNLSPGDHVVEIRSQDPSAKPWRRNVRVVAGQQAGAYAVFTATPAQAGPGLQPLAVVPRDQGQAYVVTTGSADSCTAPCTLHVPAGVTVIDVRGPASKNFRREIVIPSGPAQVTVQHFTLSRVIAGTILTVIGLPLAAMGGWLLTNPGGSDFFNEEMITGGVIGAHGLAFTIAGITQLATIRRNKADVVSLGSRLALIPPGPTTAANDRQDFAAPRAIQPMAALTLAY